MSSHKYTNTNLYKKERNKGKRERKKRKKREGRKTLYDELLKQSTRKKNSIKSKLETLPDISQKEIGRWDINL